MIREVKDNSYKLVFDEPVLFAEMLRDFVKLDILDGVAPDDIEDLSNRFIPLIMESRDSDTVKRINLKGNTPLFVIAIMEHESQVNFRMSFKMLQYITLVLSEYEKDENKKHSDWLKQKKAEQGKGDEQNKEGIQDKDDEQNKDDGQEAEGKREAPTKASSAKGFKYPPVLPIVYYDGPGKWTAEKNFLNRVELSEAFSKYIPKFEYELIRLGDYSEQDLVEFGDTLSLILLIDKIRTPDGISMLSRLPEDYIEKVQQNIPEHLLKVLADVITILLKRIHVPDDEIDNVTEKIYRRKVHDMFTFIDNYDVQETRRISKAEGKAEGIDKSVDIVSALLKKEPVADIAKRLEVTVKQVKKLQSALAQ